jgi:chromosome segregation ATPase
LISLACVFAFLGGLPACTSGDPARDGLTGGIAGITSGKYEERIEDREAELEALRGYNETLKGMLAEQEVDDALLDQQLAMAKAEYGQLESNLEKLRQSLADVESQDDADQNRLSELEDEIFRLEEEFHGLSLRRGNLTAADAARLPILNEEARQLQRSLDVYTIDSAP